MFIGLLLGPTHQLDLGVGPAVIQNESHFIWSPGYGLNWGQLDLSLHLPVRLNLNTSKLRAADSDDISDIGRLIRTIRYGNHFEFGPIDRLSDQQRLIFNDYSNRLDNDNPRTGAIARTELSGFRYTLLSDNIFTTPIVATFVQHATPSKIGFDFGIAVDGAPAPTSTAFSRPFAIAAGTLSYRVFERPTTTVTPHFSLVQAHTQGSGALIGTTGEFRRFFSGRFTITLDAIGFSRGFVMAPFDPLYLIRRNHKIKHLDGTSKAGFGGRIHLALARGPLSIGLRSLALIDAPQQGYQAYVSLSKKPFEVYSMVYSGKFEPKTPLWNARTTVGACSVRLNLSEQLMIETALLHLQRLEEKDYEPSLEASISLNWRAAFK